MKLKLQNIITEKNLNSFRNEFNYRMEYKRVFTSLTLSFYLALILCSIIFIPIEGSTLSIDVYTNKGGNGEDTNGGTYVFGETVYFYFLVNMDVDLAKATLYYPDGSSSVLFNEPLKSGLYFDYGTAGGVEGLRKLVFEAWVGNQYAVDVVYYYVSSPTYSYTISVSGIESYSVDVYLDGTWKTSLKNEGSYTFTGLSGTHTISVSNIISISSGARLLCEQSSITVSSSGSYNFQYKKQYYLSISVKPLDSGTTSKSSGWYDAGTSITVIAKPNSGYQFRGWIGDVSSSSDTITINVNGPMSVTAWFGKQNIISCKLSQTVVTRLNTLKISGSIYPSPGYSVNVKVSFILPSGSTKVVTTSTDSNGNYEVSFVPDIKGMWQVYASWEGDESFSPSKSEVTSFTVNPILYSFSIDSNIKSPNIVLVIDNEKVSSTQLPKIYRFEEFTSHTIHVESSYFEQEGVRYIFDSWSDSGKKELDRSFIMDKDISVKAIFIKQYYLKIISNFGNVEGEGWYDAGTYAYARLDRDEFPAEDVFHVYKFVRWTGDASGNSLTSDPILMDSPKVAEAVWEKRFSLLFYLVIIGAIAMATILPITYSKNLRIKVSNKIRSLMITRKKPEPPKVEGTIVKELPFTKEQIEKIVKDIEERTTSYKSYIEKSENLHKEGKITDFAFEELKNEYNSKIEELKKLKEQIEKEGKISETNYSKLKDLGLIKES